jgi:PAS domain S-box-containing protein
MRETMRAAPPPAAWPRLNSLLLTLGTIVAIELLSHTALRIVTPGAVMLLPVMYASFTSTQRAALLSAGSVVLYALVLFDRPDLPYHYTYPGMQSVATLAVAAFTVVALVGILKERIARGERSFQLLFADHPLPMWVYDRKSLAFLEVNQAAVERYGFSRDEFLRMYITDIRPPEALPRVGAEIDSRNTHRHVTGPWKHRLRNGRLIDVRTISHALSFAGHSATFEVAEDITERLRVEAHNAQLNAELERRVADRTMQLEATNRELEAFSYSVSHDLRAPLRSINGFSRALAEDYGHRLDGEGRAMLERIRVAGLRMEQLIDGLLSLSRVARSELHCEPVDLSAMAEAIGAELRQANPHQHVQLHVEPGLAVETDPQLLRIALENLLGNAWKFTAKRHDAQISFCSMMQGGVRVYAVRDNGAGFDMSYAERLFGAFQRLHPATEFPGSGIGLATVQRIITRLGGQIWAEGALDRGATFSFSLAARQPELDRRASERAHPL